MNWISVKDKLPDLPETEFDSDPTYSQNVLITNGKRIIIGWLLRRDYHLFWRSDDPKDMEKEITHWMPLPELPEGNE